MVIIKLCNNFYVNMKMILIVIGIGKNVVFGCFVINFLLFQLYSLLIHFFFFLAQIGVVLSYLPILRTVLLAHWNFKLALMVILVSPIIADTIARYQQP
jgi:hypothetical protein